ncbi:MAG: type IV pilus secretin PilQ [Deltaproteobacteria bacterium]|nr:type IV pilus secretin PilQ [Deltaproteobacteria bacterium]
MKKLNILILVLTTAIFSQSCLKQSAKAPTAADATSAGIVVSSVDVIDDATESRIVIGSSHEPKYNVFKLNDPERVVIDIIDGKMGEGLPTSIAGSGVIKEVKVQAMEDSLSALVRLEVYLDSATNYLAGLEDKGLVVRLLKPSEPAKETETPVAEAPAPLEPMAAVPIPMPEAKPEAQVEAKAELPAAELPAVPEAAPAPMAEVAPIPVPVPLPMAPAPAKEKDSEGVTKKTEVASKPMSQDIPSSGLSEGGILNDLDSKVYTGKRVSLEFQDAEVQDVIRLVAEVSKLNIITGDDVKGKLTLKLVDVPWDQALDIILSTLGLDKVQHGNILRVAPAEKLKKEREIALANDKAAKQLEPLKTKLFNVNYATAEEMAARLKNMLSERGTVDTDSRTNTIIVKDIKENLSRAENLMKALDTQTPQVRIESRIVQANDQFSRSIGIQWGPVLKLNDLNGKSRGVQFPRTIDIGGSSSATAANLSNISGAFTPPSAPTLSGFAVDALPGSTGSDLGIRLGSVNDIFNLDLHLSYAETEQLARIVSRPSISVLDNRSARIIQGTKIPFLSSSQNGSNVSFQEAGIEISVTPHITSDGSVILKVSTKSNEPGGQPVGGNPSILIREANTEMLVKSGRTAVLGGVFKTSDTRGESGVPGLKDIPILGYLFKGKSSSQTREETLIFITPYIVSDARPALTTPPGTGDLEP